MTHLYESEIKNEKNLSSQNITEFDCSDIYINFSILNFANNPITSFKNFEVYPRLITLILDNTKINSLEYVKKQPMLQHISLKKTPFDRHLSPAVMCYIGFGNQLKTYNDVIIEDDSIYLAMIIKGSFDKYLREGWVLLSLDPLQIKNTKNDKVMSLLSSEDYTNHHSDVNSNMDSGFLDIPFPSLSIETSQTSNELRDEFFEHCKELTYYWNYIPDQNMDNKIDDKCADNKEPLHFKSKEKSFIGTRSLVRDLTRSKIGISNSRRSFTCKELPYSKNGKRGRNTGKYAEADDKSEKAQNSISLPVYKRSFPQPTLDIDHAFVSSPLPIYFNDISSAGLERCGTRVSKKVKRKNTLPVDVTPPWDELDEGRHDHPMFELGEVTPKDV